MEIRISISVATRWRPSDVTCRMMFEDFYSECWAASLEDVRCNILSMGLVGRPPPLSERWAASFEDVRCNIPDIGFEGGLNPECRIPMLCGRGPHSCVLFVMWHVYAVCDIIHCLCHVVGKHARSSFHARCLYIMLYCLWYAWCWPSSAYPLSFSSSAFEMCFRA